MFDRLVKFRRGDRAKYEDLAGETKDGNKSPNAVEIPSISGQNGANTPSSTGTFPEDTYTIDQAVEALGFGKFQIKLSFFTGLVWMADAMEMMILSILSPALHCDWGLPEWQQATLTTELILCSSFTFYFGVLSAFAPNFIWILILRGLVGFGIGGVPQSVTLYTEFLPSKARAKCVVMIELFWAIGACFVVFISIFVMPTLGWRYLLGIASIPLLIFTCSCVWLPESARYEMTCGRPEKALAILQRIAKDNGKELPLGKLVHADSTQTGKEVKRGQLKDLFTPELRLTTALLWFIWLANAFSYYGVVLMTTELFEQGDECHGGSDANSDRKELACLAACHYLSTKDYIDLLWTTLAEFPGLFLTFVIIEWLGRKRTMAFEFFMFSVFVLLVNICMSRAALTFLLFVARAFISGAFQTAYVYTPEVYPTTTRAVGLGSCSGMARIGAIVTPFVAQVMLTYSTSLAICIYGLTCLTATVAALLLPIETKGREMKDTHVESKKDAETSK